MNETAAHFVFLKPLPDFVLVFVLLSVGGRKDPES